MGNYEYIVSSLPAISPEWKFGEGKSFDGFVAWIRSQLGSSDVKALDVLLQGYDEGKLGRDFYEAALKHGNRFIREFFTFDLNVRNVKARFLNKAFGFPEDGDTIPIPTGEFPEASALDGILSTADLLAREHGLDSLYWDKISEITTFNYFDLDAILGMVAKLHIIDRWSSLDEETGREMFVRLIREVRGTFGDVEYKASAD